MTNGNDAAFSRQRFYIHDFGEGGLTKREYFAAMAMQSLILKADNGKMTHPEGRLRIMRYAVEDADALIEALNQEAKDE